jgi:ribosome-associated protein
VSRRRDREAQEAETRAEPPSRSARKRAHETLQQLARRALEAPAARVDRLALDEHLAQAIRDGRRIPASSARARHIRYLGGLLAADPDGAAMLGEALAEDREVHARQVAALHRVERWRDRLLAEGDAALAELVASHPGVDAGAVRDLVRQARKDHGTGRLAATARRLFQLIKPVLLAAADD